MIDEIEVERRLKNWIRWKQGEGGGMGQGRHPLACIAEMVRDRSRFRGTTIPLFTHEAHQTNDDILALPQPLRDALLEQHLGRGNTADSLRRLGIAKATFYSRISKAHAALWTVWMTREHAARELRRANEAVIKQARP